MTDASVRRRPTFAKCVEGLATPMVPQAQKQHTGGASRASLRGSGGCVPSAPDTERRQDTRPLCPHFKAGNCRLGVYCKFSHVVPMKRRRTSAMSASFSMNQSQSHRRSRGPSLAARSFRSDEEDDLSEAPADDPLVLYRYFWLEKTMGYHAVPKWNMLEYAASEEAAFDDIVDKTTMHTVPWHRVPGRPVQKLKVIRVPCWALVRPHSDTYEPFTESTSNDIEVRYALKHQTKIVVCHAGGLWSLDFASMEAKCPNERSVAMLVRQPVTLHIVCPPSNLHAESEYAVLGSALSLANADGVEHIMYDRAGLVMEKRHDTTPCIVDCAQWSFQAPAPCTRTACERKDAMHVSAFTHECPQGQRCYFFMLANGLGDAGCVAMGANPDVPLGRRWLMERAVLHCKLNTHGVPHAAGGCGGGGGVDAVRFRARWAAGAEPLTLELVQPAGDEYTFIAKEVALSETAPQINLQRQRRSRRMTRAIAESAARATVASCTPGLTPSVPSGSGPTSPVGATPTPPQNGFGGTEDRERDSTSRAASKGKGVTMDAALERTRADDLTRTPLYTRREGRTPKTPLTPGGGSGSPRGGRAGRPAPQGGDGSGKPGGGGGGGLKGSPRRGLRQASPRGSPSPQRSDNRGGLHERSSSVLSPFSEDSGPRSPGVVASGGAGGREAVDFAAAAVQSVSERSGSATPTLSASPTGTPVRTRGTVDDESPLLSSLGSSGRSSAESSAGGDADGGNAGGSKEGGDAGPSRMRGGPAATTGITPPRRSSFRRPSMQCSDDWDEHEFEGSDRDDPRRRDGTSLVDFLPDAPLDGSDSGSELSDEDETAPSPDALAADTVLDFRRCRLGRASILSAERVCNKALWAHYLFTRAGMGTTANEGIYFTPVDRDDIALILHNGFASGRRVVATGFGSGAFGNGRHFYTTCQAARHASLSLLKCRNEMYVFMCLVCVGRAAVNRDARRIAPPLADPEGGAQAGVAYDTTCSHEDPRHAQVFVVYEGHQVYPMYLLRLDVREDAAVDVDSTTPSVTTGDLETSDGHVSHAASSMHATGRRFSGRRR